MTTYVLWLEGLLTRVCDSNGNPLSGAKLYTYATGTTTPATVYQTSSGTSHANPVVSDSAGLFAPIFLDQTQAYRFQWKTAGGSLIQDIDPITAAVIPTEASGAQVTAGTATDVFISPRRAGAGGVTLIGYTPVNKAGDTATALNLTRGTTPATNAAGFLGMPVTTLDSSSDLALSATGGMIRHTSGSAHAWTLQPVATIAHAVGATFNLRNIGSGVVTLTRGAGVTLRIAGSATDANVAIAQYGWGTVTMEATNVWVIAGTGLS